MASRRRGGKAIIRRAAAGSARARQPGTRLGALGGQILTSNHRRRSGQRTSAQTLAGSAGWWQSAPAGELPEQAGK